nr:DUF3793 family protein [Geotalea sp. SG265]
MESAEVLAGVKPANLFSIPNRTFPCGRNLYELWKSWGESIIAASPLEAYELRDRGEAMLLLLFHPHVLARLLDKPAIGVILARAGHEESSPLPQVLKRLAENLAAGTFPHEIGVLLGYPLKDVVGFMGLAPLPYTCQGPWKIYGEAKESLCLAETFRCCRRRMAEGLAGCTSPFQCLAGNPFSNGRFPFESLEKTVGPATAQAAKVFHQRARYEEQM